MSVLPLRPLSTITGWRAVAVSSRRSAALVGAATVVLVALLSAGPAWGSAQPVPAPVPPNGTALFGVQLSWDVDTPAGFAARSGLRPAVVGAFVNFPMDAASQSDLSGKVTQLADAHAALFLTVELTTGLGSVTASSARSFATTVAGYHSRGVPVYVRFAHEMNGGWYRWGQQPTAYVQAFRTLATAVHRWAPGAAMVWSPNYGGGYPFSGGQYTARPGTSDFATLDTNHDGQLTIADDPYAPYYPGDGYVDWVGLTDYYWGPTWPFGANVVPDAGRFAAELTGTYNGVSGDETPVPDFYGTYAAGKGKPMSLSETAALDNTSTGTGAAESDIKCAWIDQVYGAANARQFPMLKMVNWFEIKKYESAVNGTVDWRETWNPTVLSCLTAHATTGGFIFAR